MPTKIEKDAVTGTETTGHEWDGIKELNTPLPKWWLYTFYATIVFGIGYCIAYPSWPSLSGHAEGVLGWTQRGELAGKLAEQKAKLAPMMEKIKAAEVADIRKDPEMMAFVTAAGRTAFAENCAACHGAGGAGAPGFPILADDDWIWGGSPDQILQTVAYGVRNLNENTRLSDMPRFGADGMLDKAQVNDVSEYVLALSGTQTDKDAAGRGEAVFTENCAACHGEKGEGNVEMGAPRLNDTIWLYGGDKASVVQTVTYSRKGSMPAWAERLDPATVKVLAAYVHALGGGQ